MGYNGRKRPAMGLQWKQLPLWLWWHRGADKPAGGGPWGCTGKACPWIHGMMCSVELLWDQPCYQHLVPSQMTSLPSSKAWAAPAHARVHPFRRAGIGFLYTNNLLTSIFKVADCAWFAILCIRLFLSKPDYHRFACWRGFLSEKEGSTKWPIPLFF